MIESRQLTDYKCDSCGRVETAQGTHLRLPAGWVFLNCRFNEEEPKAKDAAARLVCSGACADEVYLEQRRVWLPTIPDAIPAHRVFKI